MNNSPRILALPLTLALIGVSACGKDASPLAAANESSASAWVLTSAPPNPQSIAAVKASAEEGDEVIMRGRIGGRMQPITDDSPVFTLMDLGIPHCGEMKADRCSTPWDYCCETPESITENAATVQIVDSEGRAVGDSPTAQGFAPLDEVIVVGTVAPRRNESVLTVRARGVYRVR